MTFTESAQRLSSQCKWLLVSAITVLILLAKVLSKHNGIGVGSIPDLRFEIVSWLQGSEARSSSALRVRQREQAELQSRVATPRAICVVVSIKRQCF